MKQDLKNKATDFAALKEEEERKMSKIDRDRKDIIYNLNLIVPENLKSIELDLTKYLFESEAVCKVLIEEIIKKAW
jgi:hypothetical protein